MSKLFSPILLGAVDLAHRPRVAYADACGHSGQGAKRPDGDIPGRADDHRGEFRPRASHPIGAFMSSCRNSICTSDERGRIGQITLAIPEFLSTENAIDLRFLFGPSSIGQQNTHSSDG
jgi:hypothetical protein